MNVIAEIQRINEAELQQGTVGTSASWHTKYADSAWVYVGNLPTQLTEGDVICIVSQFGEIEDINLVRQEDTGKSKGFAFVKYEDANSCILAVDNLTGSQVLNRTIRVDHVEKYRLPKELLEKEEAKRTDPGHAYQDKELANEYSIQQGQDLFAGPAKEQQQQHNARPENDKQKREAKRIRKEERRQKRREREERREAREDRKRAERAKRMREEDDGQQTDDKTERKQHHRKHHHKKHHKKSKRSRTSKESPSRSSGAE